MDKITKDEALKIASFTKLIINDNEIDAVVNRLKDVLEYAIRVQDMANEIDTIPSNKNINRQREDVIQLFDSQQILNQAPESQDNYFVVPKIIEK